MTRCAAMLPPVRVTPETVLAVVDEPVLTDPLLPGKATAPNT